MRVFCNPLNISYKYQFNKLQDGSIIASREAADPSMIMFKGRYYIFPSMMAGFIYSDDLVNWEYFETTHLPIYDYAPDVRAIGDYIYFCASTYENGVYYRTKDPFSDEYETIQGAFPFWDPNLFEDEDGRFYFYWGSSTTEPLYGIELDRNTMQPIGEKVGLCSIDTEIKGYERNGEDHVPARTKEEIDAAIADLEHRDMPPAMKEAAINFIMQKSYMEGVWVNKHNGLYYLQYASPSSGKNIYGDGVYISENPLGPYRVAPSNPYSYKPGGFLPAAGHGSTMEDPNGSQWHISTMRICKNHNFKRRIGLWAAGYDADGDLFCNQRYGDWPMDKDKLEKDPWADPDWMLLSYGKEAEASSYEEGCRPGNIADENIQTWWKAADSGEAWVTLDLGKEYDVHAVQINFADDMLKPQMPENAKLEGAILQERWIDTSVHFTRWLLEGSLDGKDYFVIEDKRNCNTDLSHDLAVREEGMKIRFLKLTVTELPYGQNACVSGLRVFGLDAAGKKPEKASDIKYGLAGPLDLYADWTDEGALSEGYVVNWGYAPEKLYHSRQTFEPKVHIGALIKDQSLYIRIDSFNAAGITEGDVITVIE